MKLQTVNDTATRWGISPRRVQQLINEGRVKGAQKVGRDWLIPTSTPKPKSMKPHERKQP